MGSKKNCAHNDGPNCIVLPLENAQQIIGSKAERCGTQIKTILESLAVPEKVHNGFMLAAANTLWSNI